NQVTADLNAAANDPASSLSGIQVVNDVNQFLSQSKSISGSLDGLSTQADTQISSDVGQVNQLLAEISGLNQNIAQATASGADPTDSQEAQNELITQLSGLIDIRTQPTSTGGQTLTSMSGVQLVGQGGAATLAYTPSTTASSQLTITQPGGAKPVNLQLQS